MLLLTNNPIITKTISVFKDNKVSKYVFMNTVLKFIITYSYTIGSVVKAYFEYSLQPVACGFQFNKQS